MATKAQNNKEVREMQIKVIMKKSCISLTKTKTKQKNHYTLGKRVLLCIESGNENWRQDVIK